MKQLSHTNWKAAVSRLLLRILMIALLITMVFPLLWNIISSFKTNTEYLTDPFALPCGFAWENYVNAFKASNMSGTFLNSVYVVVMTTVMLLACAVPCSYAVSRYRFFGSKLLMGILVTGLFISSNYVIIPLFMELRKLHLLNSLTALAVVYATYSLPLSVFLLSGFMREIPKDYEEAAILDGCNTFGLLKNIVIPLSKPTILTIAIITVLSSWNEYAVALVIITDPAKQTFPVGLANLFEVQRYATDWGALFAALVISMLPTLLLFLFGEKYVVKGMSIGGIKG